MVDQSLSKHPLSDPGLLPGDALPFFGLGFDLTTVRVAGAACRLVDLRHEAAAEAVDVYFYIPRNAGYALLVEQGREIRGR